MKRIINPAALNASLHTLAAVTLCAATLLGIASPAFAQIEIKLGHVGEPEDGLRNLEPLVGPRLAAEQIGPGADHRDQ